MNTKAKALSLTLAFLVTVSSLPFALPATQNGPSDSTGQRDGRTSTQPPAAVHFAKRVEPAALCRHPLTFQRIPPQECRALLSYFLLQSFTQGGGGTSLVPHRIEGTQTRTAQ